MDQRKLLGANIRAHREKRGWSQEELAGRLQCSVFTISHIERGKGFPTLDTLFKLMKAFAVSADTLLGVVPNLEEKDEQNDRVLALLPLLQQLSPVGIRIAKKQIKALIEG
ncbi:helix-turn-helix domain-containing protein [Eilatimonas milleporae]|uniref:Helix-turn-helix protein n=1 Tax=Eilatimonas milleporae TaxID=911205 RepID=A0A3M0C4B1_9PROT|nr:helix-turn-helix transcriptional regulator [Eilatimonas milleporae]RMB01919.1 helix-turn-helix protein [Eilatimonas milleporae]